MTSELPECLRQFSGRSCFVYMMTSDLLEWPGRQNRFMDCAVFKLGISENPFYRLETFKTAVPFKLSIHRLWKLPSRAIAFAVEQTFHKDHQHERLQGEWFFHSVPLSSGNMDYIICRYAEESLRLHPRDIVSLMMSAGLDQASARDSVIAEFGEEALA